MLLDVTLRDGGFVNGFAADCTAMSRYIDCLAAVPVDVIELGYCGGLPADHGDFPAPGPSFDLPPHILRQLVERSPCTCAVMIHPSHPRAVDLHAIQDSGVSLVRIPIRPGDGHSPWLLASNARKVGLRVSINLILMSWWTEAAIAAAASRASDVGATVVYLADTNSAMNPRQVGVLVSVAREGSRRLPIGFHAHDGFGLAMANTSAAVAAGAEWVDAAMGGVGRGAGNLSHEVLLVARGLRQEAAVALRTFPIVRSIFGRPSEHEVWERLCALLDVSPACSAKIVRIANNLGKNPIDAALQLLPLAQLTHPLSEDELRAMLNPMRQ